MSTPVDNSLTGLKASTAQIMAIISGAQQILPGNSYFSLTTQAQVIKDYGSGPLPSIVLLCSKELLHIQGMTPQVWPNWHNIGYNNPCLLTHVWHPKLLAWEALDSVMELSGGASGGTSDIAGADGWGGKVHWNQTCGGRSSNWEIKGEELGVPDMRQETGIVVPNVVPVGPDLGSHALDVQ
ncbi:uncharacterized protein BJ212DRAFT_1299348 [Suillus subaureus]|uniref:Uncharacterized protein n=1 Tax=Suillus subaureus TaxID=48587 RepID=A0A9P7ECN5_9AGAM|nr:uncharacterized protein BJ212DRAFT_1299348 [Suillus subaureus]KAG1817188.1 hypothetical protein BJ212DRAFT_1299348 [Suillus subaureus]